MKILKHNITDPASLRRQVLRYTSKFNDAVVCDSVFDSRHNSPFTRKHPLVAGLGVYKKLGPGPDLWERMDNFIAESKKSGNWVLGYLSYDLKNEIEELHSRKPDRIGFQDLCLMVPQVVITLNETEVTIISMDVDPEECLKRILLENSNMPSEETRSTIKFEAGLAQSEYIDRVKALLDHIQRGDIYEVNFCQDFHAAKTIIDPYETYLKLTQSSPNQFSCFVKENHKYLLCASPERFLQRTGDRITSQPIKGTIKRGNNVAEDEMLKQTLASSEKDRSENVMIVDLVRNDLSRIAAKASVKVDELFGVYPFPGVYQMISTVSCNMRPETGFSEIIKSTFPMGSMTGAPKVRAMELIEEYETMKRGLFSGSVGYIDPYGDLDLNVVIRSIFFNADKKNVALFAGGAITSDSDPKKEYEESLLKLKFMFSVLGAELPEQNDTYA